MIITCSSLSARRVPCSISYRVSTVAMTPFSCPSSAVRHFLASPGDHFVGDRILADSIFLQQFQRSLPRLLVYTARAEEPADGFTGNPFFVMNFLSLPSLRSSTFVFDFASNVGIFGFSCWGCVELLRFINFLRFLECSAPRYSNSYLRERL